MGNSLLDFVMALVRDREIAARYAADPAAVLADADLPGVTIADVDNLIPVVTDSLAASTPAFGATAEGGNVWTSGAAVAAFDAFAIPVPPVGPDQPAVTLPPAATSLDQPGYDGPVDGPAPAPAPDGIPAHLPIEPVYPEPEEPSGEAGWPHPHVDPQADHHPGDPAGFDLF